MIKGIIFDFDGVILDSVYVKTEAFADLYKEFGEEIQQKVVEYHLSNGGVSRFEKFKYFHKYFLNITLNEDEIQALADHFSALVFDKVVASDFIPGAEELLERLEGRILTFVATGTPQNEVMAIVEARNLGKYFNELHGSPTKKPVIIKDILQRYSLSPSEVLFIGDAMTDYKAALETDLNFIGVQNKDTKFPPNTKTVNTLTEIIAFI